MNRRGFLRGAAVVGTVGVAGCLERLGFEEQSAWSNPPIVDGRPDAVYLPAGTEEMGTYGRASDGEYAVALTYTIPHRFWTIAGQRERVEVGTDDSLHLMATVWDPETDTVLPVNLGLEIRRDGDPVGGQLSPWPMLSQRMGFHYGDNVGLPSDGEYTARLRVGPLEPRGTGAFADRLESASTFEIDLEFDPADVHDLGFDTIDEDRRGTRDALPLMDHGGDHGDGHEGHDGHEDGGSEGHREPGHPPMSTGIPIDELPAAPLGTERSGDARITALVADSETADRVIDEIDSAGETDRSSGDAYVLVCPRTPYHDISLPFASLTVTHERNGSTRLEDEPLIETIDHELGHHYGTVIDGLDRGDEIEVSVDSPPQVARHDGYETAFFDFEDVSYVVD